MCAFRYAWSLPVTWKHGGHTIRSVVAENLMPRRYHDSIFYRTNRSYSQSKFYIAGIGISIFSCFCNLDLDPMTFTYLISIPWRYNGSANANTSRLWKLSSNRQTDRQIDRYDLRGWSTIWSNSTVDAQEWLFIAACVVPTSWIQSAIPYSHSILSVDWTTLYPPPRTANTRCSAIAERPRCRVRYIFRQK